MFFTSGLLHWADRALQFVPEDVEVILLGSDLLTEEIEWLETTSDRPFHHIQEQVDDNAVLDFLFDVTEGHFGWLHIDCFVLDPDLFSRMSSIDDDVVANSIWSQPAEDGSFRALHSAYVFFNRDVLEAVREAGMSGSPLAAHYRGIDQGRVGQDHRLHCRVPTGSEITALHRVLPARTDGLPQYPHDGPYFQVLVLYQAVAEALGYRTHAVLDLLRDGSSSAAHYSNDILHVNGVATYQQTKHIPGSFGNRFYPLLLQADYQMLSTMSGEPPPYYRNLRRKLEGELVEAGLDPALTGRNLGAFLLERGVEPERARRVLGEGDA